jgi:competence protein ComEC
MDSSPAPAVLPSCAFAAGIGAHLLLARPASVAQAAALGALGLCLGHRAGRALACAAAGALVALLGTPAALPGAGAVAAATGRVCEPWSERPGTWSGTLCLERLAWPGGLVVAAGRARLRVELPRSLGPPPWGAGLRVRGPLVRAPGFANERAGPPGPLRLRVKSVRFLELERPPGPVARLGGRVRAIARRPFEAPGRAERPGLALARALVLGEAAALGESWQRALRRCGLAHLVAVSGFNVSLVALFAGAAGAWLPRPARLGTVGVAVAVYVLAVGPSPSVLRASLMALLALGGLALGRVPRARQGLALALVACLALAPELCRDPGFQLSFSATAGLLGLAPRWAERWSGVLPKPIALPAAAALAAQVAALPWSVAAFGDWSPLAPLFNLAAGPWSALALAGSLVWTILALVAPRGVGDLAARALDPLTLPLDALAALPPSALVATAWPGGWASGLALALMLAALAEGGRWRRAAALALLAAVTSGHGRSGGGLYEAVFVDVGQGDATLLTQGGEAILIDGGGAPGYDLGGRVLLPLLADRGITGLRLAVLSHPDRDHCLGLADLAAQFSIQEVWAPAGVPGTACLAALERRSRSGVRRPVAGQRFERAGFELEVLHPGRGPLPAGDNRSSLVLRASAGGRRLLFTGDLDGAGEEALVRRARSRLGADLLKVAHHGSAGSSTSVFLAAVRPRLAVVSAGANNPFGHPAGSVLERLEEHRVRVLRTDRDGEVAVRWRASGPWRLRLPGSPRAIPPAR